MYMYCFSYYLESLTCPLWSEPNDPEGQLLELLTSGHEAVRHMTAVCMTSLLSSRVVDTDTTDHCNNRDSTPQSDQVQIIPDTIQKHKVHNICDGSGEPCTSSGVSPNVIQAVTSPVLLRHLLTMVMTEEKNPQCLAQV